MATANAVSLQRLIWPALEALSINVYLRRDDEISSLYSGNKFYKLYYNLKHAVALDAQAIVSFGGNYSNHLYALAAMGQELGLQTVGVVRGYEAAALSPTLKDARSLGMRLFFLGKKDYRSKDISHILPLLNKQYKSLYLIPEGGENLAGVRGCLAMGRAIETQMSKRLADAEYTVCCAVATGSTFAGLIAASPRHAKCLGISVLKGEDTLVAKVQYWLSLLGVQSSQRWHICNRYHHGGYAKVSPPLIAFMRDLETLNNIQLEPVYMAKLLWGIKELATNNYWSGSASIPRKETNLVVIHSGGLQGRRGFNLD
jgi:1-aminocyclopropane-1-carboxylate deaminase